jgi:hypothetical protein
MKTLGGSLMLIGLFLSIPALFGQHSDKIAYILGVLAAVSVGVGLMFWLLGVLRHHIDDFDQHHRDL